MFSTKIVINAEKKAKLLSTVTYIIVQLLDAK